MSWDGLRKINAGDLSIAYHEVGPTNGTPIILLHGFPYDARAYDEAAAILAREGFRCLAPYLRGYGETRLLSSDTMRSGQQAALGADLLAFMEALHLKQAYLGGYDWGGRAACIVSALWPNRVLGLVSCGTGYNIQDIANASHPGSPEEETRFWYQYYFHTERGRNGLTQNRQKLCEHIWRLWSPSWAFDGGIYAATAQSFENPDFVDVVIHSYRHRYGGISGDDSYDTIESQLACHPKITVPTYVLQGADDGVDPPSCEDHDAMHFTGWYRRRILESIGHNLPQEAPKDFAQAVLELKAAEKH